MYKVFVNDCPIIITDAKKISTNLRTQKFASEKITSLVEKLFIEKSDGIQLYSNNLLEDWRRFKQQFYVQKAAGGKVINDNNEVLFIKRLGKWDLPKGKLEIGETIEKCAVREVEEECGMKNLEIQKELATTYHIFKRNQKTVLKITYWYLMRTSFKGIPKPQHEEGIIKAEFKNNHEIEKALQNTYANIRSLF